MRTISLLLALVSVSSCSGMKVLKNPPPQPEKPKPGLTFGSGAIGSFQVQKVGMWCDVRHGIMTFGAFGPTEDEAKANARGKCLGMFKDGPCDVVSCKPPN